MIRRLALPVTPGGEIARAAGGRALRILAVSDEIDPTLEQHLEGAQLHPLDLLVSCGDLPPDYLAYLEGSLRAPFLFVTGNHDLDEAWRQEAARHLPEHRRGAILARVAGLTVALFDWPGAEKARTPGQARVAWRHALGLWLSSRLRAWRPAIVVSHVAPHDPGEPADVYHRSFPAYHWFAEAFRPELWLHGHTTPATVPERVTHIGPTTCVNVTGAYLIELVPEDGAGFSSRGAPSGDLRADRPPAARNGSSPRRRTRPRP